MKTKICLMIIAIILLGAASVQADTVWTSGHHEIIDGDVYGEIYIYNDVTLDILGGDVYKLETFDITVTNRDAGEITELFTHDESIVNIHGGQLSRLQATNNSVINLYAYDVIHTTTGGYWDAGQLTGKYLNDNSNFVFDLHYTAYPHITIIPEPVDAAIEIEPHTLNLASKGKWLTCHIWLPEDCNVGDIEPNSVLLQLENEPNAIDADWLWFDKEEQVVMAKFKRLEVESILEPGQVELTISGRLSDGTYFKGTDIIKVINKSRRKK